MSLISSIGDGKITGAISLINDNILNFFHFKSITKASLTINGNEVLTLTGDIEPKDKRKPLFCLYLNSSHDVIIPVTPIFFVKSTTITSYSIAVKNTSSAIISPVTIRLVIVYCKQ